ncbi:M10 family metallopeptidase C-terminal domain-containing protein [Niveispirillum fermenti]|uniref:M10 family metallopeptidase C-terminal domain-containing protein n=1 Tax=Niveispirillum fermenti TaxID=1233113 RepID=UPI003A89370C
MCVLCGIGAGAHAITMAELAAMASGAGGKPVLSDAAFIDRLQDADGGAWAPGRSIGFSFPVTRPAGSSGADYAGFNSFTTAQMQSARLALDLWSDVARLTFVENAAPSARQGQITFANSDTISSGVWGFAFTSGTTRPLWVNHGTGDTWSGNTPGHYDFSALLHEIGHTLGLLHPGDYNASGSNRPVTYANNADFYQDSAQYTLMSYFSAGNTGANHGSRYASTPMMYDILAVQDFYGRNYATRDGDTVYGFNSTAGRSVFDFTINRQPVVAIWDGGGRNTLDLSGFAAQSSVDMRPGSYSDVAGLARNLSLAVGTFISRVATGTGADTVRDNALDNHIVTGGGNDTILLLGGGNDTVDGGGGEDIVHLPGRTSDYRIVTTIDGSLLIKGPAGSALVSNVENFRFLGSSESLTREQMAALDFNSLLYLASNPDLIAAFGPDTDAARSHWITFGQAEGRLADGFDALDYLASNLDLIGAFGLDATAAMQHYVTYGLREGRTVSGFDAMAYLASDPARLDLIGVSRAGGMLDFIQTGAAMGQGVSFSGLSYIASYADLRAAFGLDAAAGVAHYVHYGYKEYREISFDPAIYLASHPDLVRAFGGDGNAAYAHYFAHGAGEGRATDRFNPYDYLGSNPDLAASVGHDAAALTRHYLLSGFAEGRTAGAFDTAAYAMTHDITGEGWQAAAVAAYLSAPVGGTPFGTDQADHRLIVEQAMTGILSESGDNDWFMFRGAAYTNYKITLEFPGLAGIMPMAQLLTRGQDNVVVTSDMARPSGLSVRIFTQQAEDVYLELRDYSSRRLDYRITVTVDAGDTVQATGAGGAVAAWEALGLAGPEAMEAGWMLMA